MKLFGKAFAIALLVLVIAGSNASYAQEPSSVGVGFVGRLTVSTACRNLDDLREILRSRDPRPVVDEKFARQVCGPISDKRVVLDAIIEPVVLGIGGTVCIVEVLGGVFLLNPVTRVEFRTYVAIPLRLIPDCVPPGS